MRTNATIAADLMTENPRSVHPYHPVRLALEGLQAMDVRHLPVVDDDQELVGIISDRDLRVDADGFVIAPSNRPVAEFMSSDVVSVHLDTALVDVIEIMMEHRLGAIPVVDRLGTLMGIVSYVDILRAMYNQGFVPPTTGSEGSALSQ